MPLEMPFEDLTGGTLVTQDHTIQGASEHTYWQRIADVTDMSGYAVAYVAAMHGVPCHIVKVVSGQIGREDAQLKRTLEQAHQTMSAWLTTELERLVPKG
jgi:nucleoside phosphorylase